jgi:hypothetical protein
MATNLPAEQVTLDQIFNYRDGSGLYWINLKTEDGYLDFDGKADDLQSFASLRRTAARQCGVTIVSDRYADPFTWQRTRQSAALRGLR